MIEDDMLATALADVRQRRTDLQADHARIRAELTKLQMAERALAAIVEGAPLDAGALMPLDDLGEAGISQAGSRRATGRGSRGPRGPRANSAKARLKAVLQESGPDGLSQAEISSRLPDVAVGTINAYLNAMVSSGEAERRDDRYTAGIQSGEPGPEHQDADQGEAAA